MQRLEVSVAVRPIYESLGVKRLIMTYFHGQVPNVKLSKKMITVTGPFLIKGFSQ